MRGPSWVHPVLLTLRREYVLCKYLAQEQFDEYFKFSIVRNAWDRMVSMYKYFEWGPHINFKRSSVDAALLRCQASSARDVQEWRAPLALCSQTI
jgi:hypothetical protein